MYHHFPLAEASNGPLPITQPFLECQHGYLEQRNYPRFSVSSHRMSATGWWFPKPLCRRWKQWHATRRATYGGQRERNKAENRYVGEITICVIVGRRIVRSVYTIFEIYGRRNRASDLCSAVSLGPLSSRGCNGINISPRVFSTFTASS